MHLDNEVKIIIGIILAIVGAGVLLQTRGTRGFGQRKQAGALMLVAGAFFLAVGLGYLNL